MEVQHERDSSGLSSIVAEVPAELVDEVYQSALRELKRHAHVPGFRPGKVPPRLVESIVGKEAIENLAKERLEDRVMPEIAKALPHVVTLDDPQIELAEFAKGQPTRVTVKVLTAVVELAQPGGLEVEQFRAEVTDEEAAQELSRYHAGQAETSTADHEDIRDGDRVTFALRIIRDGYLVEEYTTEDPLGIVIGSNSLDPNIDQDLIGLSVGQSATFEVAYPDDYSNEELRGAAAEFSVQILEVGQQESLEAFVARLELGESVAAATTRVAESMKNQRESYYRIMAREAAVEQMIEASTIDIPRAQIEAAVMEELEEFEESLEERGLDVDGADDESIEAEEERIRSQVELDLKRDVLLQAVSQINVIEVEVEDLSREVSMISNYNRVSPELLLRRLDESGELRQVVRNARMRKAAELLLDQVKVVEVDPPAEEEHVHDEHCDHDHGEEHAAAVRGEAVDDEPAIVDDPVDAVGGDDEATAEDA